MTDWISVDERLPEVGLLVLCAHAEQGHVIGNWDGDEWVLWTDGPEIDHRERVTHWMPLPDLPEDV